MVLDNVSDDEYIENSLDQSCLTEILRESLKPTFQLKEIHDYLNFSSVIDIPNRITDNEEMEAETNAYEIV
jgi:hypothetical protein